MSREALRRQAQGHPGGEPNLRWDTADLWAAQRKYLIEEEGHTEAEAAALLHHESFEDDWENLLDCLTWFMEQLDIVGSRAWRAEVSNFGWRNQSGYKDFNADNGRELLRKVLPDTDCTFNIWFDTVDWCIRIQNSHHDSPTGNERYEVRPEVPEYDSVLSAQGWDTSSEVAIMREFLEADEDRWEAFKKAAWEQAVMETQGSIAPAADDDCDEEE